MIVNRRGSAAEHAAAWSRTLLTAAGMAGWSIRPGGDQAFGMDSFSMGAEPLRWAAIRTGRVICAGERQTIVSARGGAGLLSSEGAIDRTIDVQEGDRTHHAIGH